jgi:hypothetical protein
MRAARTDANQRAIVDALRRHGASVVPTHTLGRGFPDLICGYLGVTYLLELKDGNKAPSAQALTDDELWFIGHWRGRPVALVRDVAEALKALGIKERNDGREPAD